MNKKDFSNNPALQFVSGANVQKTAEVPEVPEGFKRNPEFIEKKTKRVQLVMQPSLYEKAKAAAEEQGISFNAYLHQVLANALQEE